MKKMPLVLMTMLMLAGSLWAGGNQEQEGSTGEVTLIIAGRDGSYGDAMTLAMDAYKEIRPEVSFEFLPLSGSALFEQTVVDLGSGAGSYDIILMDDPNAPQYMAAGWLADLDALMKESGMSLDQDFIPSAVGVARYPAGTGTLYALPHVGNVELFAYRTDLFEKYGLGTPDTWTQVLEAARTLSEEEEEISPVLFRGSKGNPIVTGFLPILWSFGADVLDSNGRVVINSAASKGAVDFFLELSRYAPEGVANYQSAQVRDALYSGTGAMAIEVWPGWIKDINNPDESSVAGKMAIVSHPGEVKGSSPMIGIWLTAIPESSENKKEALEFLTFLTSAEMQKRISLEAGVPPTRASTHMDAEVDGKYFWYKAQLDGLKNGVARPRTAHWKELEAVLGDVLQRALIGEISSADALAQAESRMKDIVQ